MADSCRRPGDEVLARIREREYDPVVAMIAAAEPDFDVLVDRHPPAERLPRRRRTRIGPASDGPGAI